MLLVLEGMVVMLFVGVSVIIVVEYIVSDLIFHVGHWSIKESVFCVLLLLIIC